MSDAPGTFDFVKSITDKNHFDWDEDIHKDYDPFVLNKYFSFIEQTCPIVNEMNVRAHIDDFLQYEFMYRIVPKGKYYQKWIKPEKQAELNVLKELYGMSTRQAEKALEIINIEGTYESLVERIEKGGKNGKR